jgi:hypothetical protein
VEILSFNQERNGLLELMLLGHPNFPVLIQELTVKVATSKTRATRINFFISKDFG